MKDAILRKIRMDELVMRPRFYFTFKVVTTAVVAVLVLLVSILLFNFLLFSIHTSGRDTLLDFGPRGYSSFLQVFPWPLLLADIGLIALLFWLVRQFKFGYKSPLLYMLGGLFILTLGLGVFIDQATGLNGLLVDQEQQGHLPHPFDDLYKYGSQPPQRGHGVYRCTITGISGNTITAEDIDPNKTIVLRIVLPANSAQATTSGLSVGDVVFVAGDEQNGIIQAFGVSKTPPDNMRSSRHH